MKIVKRLEKHLVILKLQQVKTIIRVTMLRVRCDNEDQRVKALARGILAILLWFSYKRIWRNVEH